MNKKGFSLLEIIVVLSVLGIMAAVIIPSISGPLNKSKVIASYSRVVSVQMSIDRYKKVTGNYPGSIATLVPEYLESEIPDKDAWGNSYYYDSATGKYSSVGPDGQGGTADDIYAAKLP